MEDFLVWNVALQKVYIHHFKIPTKMKRNKDEITHWLLLSATKCKWHKACVT